jgi:transitional endoplasmic reticulum ATPase
MHRIEPWSTVEAVPVSGRRVAAAAAVHSFFMGRVLRCGERIPVQPGELRVVHCVRRRRLGAEPIPEPEPEPEPSRCPDRGVDPLLGFVTPSTVVLTPEALPFKVHFFDLPGEQSLRPSPQQVLCCHPETLIRSLQSHFSTTATESRSASTGCWTMLHGPAGGGKTCLVAALSEKLRSRLVVVSAGYLMASAGAEADKALDQAFTYCEDCSGESVVLLLDGLDRLIPTEKESASDDVSAGLINRLLLAKARRTRAGVSVVAVTSQLDLVHSSARRCFEDEVRIAPACERERLAILGRVWSFVEGTSGNPMSLANGKVVGDLELLARSSHNFGACDLYALAESYFSSRSVRDSLASVNSSSSSLGRLSSAGVSAPMVPQVRWSEVGGLDDAKQTLIEMVVWPRQHPDAFRRLGISPPSGVLLYGAPGTGKTMLAKAAATETGSNFVELRASEVVRGAVGESEKAVRAAFKAAAEAAPSILFIDEFQALFASRDSSGGGIGSRLASQLLLCMDDIARRKQACMRGGDVVVLAATNLPNAVDTAFLRPGRFDSLLYTKLPSQRERLTILELAVEQVGGQDGTVDLEDLSRRTEGFSGADLAALARNAVLAQLSQGGACAWHASAQGKPSPLSSSCLEEALLTTRASTDAATVERYDRWRPQQEAAVHSGAH